ncbi:MAG: hypothetical protein AAFY35_09475 [Pseudomonadota bacterium]
MHLDDDLSTLVDELGTIRAEMNKLRCREAGLRQRLLEARSNAPIEGRDYTMTIRRGQRRSFDHAALPDRIREDLRYWKVTPTATVLTKPRVRAPDPRPVQRGEDDFQVIEPF